jgi:hypothetical protein
MGRVVLSVPVLVTVVGGLAVAALAQAPGASAAPAAADPVPGKPVCTITDERLTEISGMVATSGGYVVVNDSSEVESRRKIFFLDGKCKVKDGDAVSYPSRPRDPEDIAQATDGTIWVADIGDNPDAAERRSTIALWRLPKGADEPSIFRMKYPDGPRDAEALLLAGDGTPVIVTKEAGKAGLYTPAGPLAKGQTVALRRAGEFTVPKTTTSNPLAAVGRLVVTGGANAPDGGRVVLRTYADAFEFDVSNGNVVEAITKGTPRITPLPDEPRGESITYSADGKSFLTVSEAEGPKILQYTPAAFAAAVKAETQTSAAAGDQDTRSWFQKLTLNDITYMIGGVGVLGLLLVGVGVFGIMRARRRPPGPDQDAVDGSGVTPSGPEGPQAMPISMPGAAQGYDPSVWDRQPPVGRTGGTEYRSGSAPGGQYRSNTALQNDQAYRPAAPAPVMSNVQDQVPPASGSTAPTGRGAVYGSRARGSASASGTVYGGDRAGGSYYSPSNQYDPLDGYANRERGN